MPMPTKEPTAERYKHHHFPAEMISHCVGLYYRSCLSYRNVEELRLVRGIIVTYEAIRIRSRVRSRSRLVA